MSSINDLEENNAVNNNVQSDKKTGTFENPNKN